MATSITSRNFSLEPTSTFRFHEGPPKSQHGCRRTLVEKRKIDPSPGIPFIDIDEIVPPNPEPNEENSVLIESDSDSETDSVNQPLPYQPLSNPRPSSPPPSHEQPYDEHSDDELPDIQDLLCSGSSQKAYIVPGPATSQQGCPGDFGDDVTLTAHRSEGNCTGSRDDQDNDDNDDDNNNTELECSALNRRGSVFGFYLSMQRYPRLKHSVWMLARPSMMGLGRSGKSYTNYGSRERVPHPWTP